MINFAVLIPAYNEQKTIRSLITKVLQITPNVILVNDASTDNTKQECADLAIEYIELTENSGKAAALQAGFAKAEQMGFEAVITIDGDGQHDPAEIDKLVAAFAENPNSVIIAARVLNRENAPSKRRRANDIADFWVSWAASTKIKDSQSGFRLYPIKLVESLTKNYSKTKGFVFESEVLIQAAKQGFNFIFVPIVSSYPANNRASHFRPVFDITQITLMVAGYLLKSFMNPIGLIKSLRGQPTFYPKEFKE